MHRVTRLAQGVGEAAYAVGQSAGVMDKQDLSHDSTLRPATDNMEPVTGIEPATLLLQVRRSTN